MEKFIYQVKIERIFKSSEQEEILRIEDHQYQFYFIRSKQYDDIYHYIYKTDDTNNIVLDNKKYQKSVLKKKIINLDIIEENEVLYITRKHLYQYDYNLWNEVNDWLNGLMMTKYKEYQLLFIPSSYALVSVEQKVPFSKEN